MMSSEPQTKRRRDNKKKRKDDVSIEENENLPLELPQTHSNPKTVLNGELNIHLHTEPATGGGLCAKLVFFVLLTVLTGLIALLVNEHRENTEFEVIHAFQNAKHVKSTMDELAVGRDVSEEDLENKDEYNSDSKDEFTSTEANDEKDVFEEYKEVEEEEEEYESNMNSEASELSEEAAEDKDSEDEQEELEEDRDEVQLEHVVELVDDSISHENSEEDKEERESHEHDSTETVTAIGDENVPAEIVENQDDYHSIKVNQDELESEDEQEIDGPDTVYQLSETTNSDDWLIREELDNANNTLKNDAAYALTLFNKILEKNPLSPRALYGKAQCIDILAEKKQSNNLLQETITTFLNVLNLPNVPNALFQLAAERCINRMRFGGKYLQATSIHEALINRFPEEIKFRNELAVTYLTINKVAEAKSVLEEVLVKWPEDGFALVHYGFILKTHNNDFEASIKFLQKGIQTEASGVVDGRFYFHLGDALTKLGQHEEAFAIYENGVSKGLFLSKYQRSLYNVARLVAKPWWSKVDFVKTTLFECLENNWIYIRNESLRILNKQGYFKPETENLKDVGEWKQFELYSRGVRNIENCKQCPLTCKILSQFPEATTCRRGQIKFSVMQPGTHVWPHCGPTNCRLRIHLGLKVPRHTYIRVAEEMRTWKEGKLLIFDDSFEHEVWHNGTSVRLVLIVDIWHPELTQSEKQKLTSI